MLENEPNIYIADEGIKFGSRDVCFGILFQKKLAPRGNPPLTHFGAIKMGRNVSNIFNLSFSGPIYTKFVILT